MSERRVSKHWEYNPANNVEKFDLSTLTKSNLVNQLLVLKQEDIAFSVIMELLGSFNGKSFCNRYDTFDVPAGAYKYDKNNDPNKPKIVSNKSKFTTTIGIWIFNITFIRDNGLCPVLGYINKEITDDVFSDMQQTLIFGLMEDKITVPQYKKFLEYTQFFMPFETVLNPNHTEKLVSIGKTLNKKKAELYKKYKDQLDKGDVAVAEKMEKELLAYAKEYLGDDPGLDVYMSGAGSSWGNNFKNMYVMKGAMRDPDPNAKQQFNIATSNWIDGISADEYSLVANSLAAGPYARSKKTELGGYWEKLITAAFSTMNMDPPGSDCGSKMYVEVELDKSNYKDWMYSYIIKSDGKLEELTTDNLDKYLGKKVKFRFAAFCKSRTGICNCCGGNFFYRRGNGRIGLAMAQIPTKLKLSSMKGFHNSTIKTYEVDPYAMFLGVK